MWIRHPRNGNVVLVLDEAHITRLLGEGGTEELAPSPAPPASLPSPVVAAPEKEKTATGPTRPKKR